MEDFNLPSEERTNLLKRLDKVLGAVAPHFWAACQICDLCALERLVVAISQPGIRFNIASNLETNTRRMVHYWSSSLGVQSQPSTPKMQSQPSTPKTSMPSTPAPQKSTTSDSDLLSPMLPPPPKRQKILDSLTPLPRDLNVKKRAEKRDNLSCVLTGVSTIEVAHIYPHYAMKYREEESGQRYKFWEQLWVFWPQEKVTAWEARLFPQGIYEKGSEEVYNLITLAPTVHTIWRQGLFALKPIFESDNKTTLEVQFFWQETQQRGFPSRINLTTTPNSTQGLQQGRYPHGGYTWIFDKDGKKIKSGDCFKLHTNDPIQKPLPDFELLELQWFLHRIQGMAGAADVDQEEGNSDSDDTEDIPGLTLDDDNNITELSLLLEEPISSPERANLPLPPPLPLSICPKSVAVDIEGDEDRERDLIQFEQGY